MEKKYYAFISYSHKDEKYAAGIHRQLMSYRLPSYARKELRRDLKPQPICIDKHTLPPGELWEMLKQKLDDSRYLVVVCSPNSAVPGIDKIHWVNREIEYFIEKNGTSNIVPVIVGGKPGGGDQECFPPALRSGEILALDATKEPKQKILSFLVAKLLGLDPDMLYRYDIQAKKTKFIKIFCLLLPLLVLLFAFLFFMIDYNRTIVNYYADYVDSYGLPQGIFQLSKENIRHRHIHYRFEYQGYRFKKSLHADSSDWSLFRLFGMQRVLRRVVQATSKGAPVSRNHTEYGDRPQIQEFKYNNSLAIFADKLVSVSCKNPGAAGSQKIFEYSDFRGVINGKVTIKRNEGSLMRQTARLTLSKDDLDNQGMRTTKLSPVTGYEIKRNKEGRAVERFCLDAYGYYVSDEDGIQAFKFELDDEGRQEKIWYLYKDAGQWKRRANKDGVAGKVYTFEHENLKTAKYVGLDEAPVTGPHGWAVCENGFDPNGNYIFSIFKDSEGNVALDEKYSVAGQIASYDQHGNRKQVMVHCGKQDSEGKWIPIVSKEKDLVTGRKKDSFTYIYFDYDDHGYVVSETYKNAANKPCIGVASGYCSAKYTYKNFRLTGIDYFGTDEKTPAANSLGMSRIQIDYNKKTGNISQYIFLAPAKQGGIWGYPDVCKVIRRFNAEGNVTSDEMFDWHGNPAVNTNGIHKTIYIYDEKGTSRLLRQENLAPEGKGGVYNWKNIGKLVQHYDEKDRIISEEFYGIDGTTPVTNGFGTHKMKFVYNHKGQKTSEEYYGIDGRTPASSNMGAHKIVFSYTPEGYIESNVCLGEKGEPVANAYGIHKTIYTYTPSGDLAVRIFKGAKGESVANKFGIHKTVNVYNKEKQWIKIENYALPGKGGVYQNTFVHKVVQDVDKKGLVVAARFFGVDCKTPVVNNMGVHKIIYENNWRGHKESEAYYGGVDGKTPIKTLNGIHKIIYTYDAIGRMESASCFNVKGERVNNNDRIHRIVSSFNRKGEPESHSFYNTRGEPTENKSGVHKIVFTYTEKGQKESEAWFGKNGVLKTSPNGIHKWKFTYDQKGNLVKTTFFSIENMPASYHFAAAEELFFPAKFSGLEPDDLILSYGGSEWINIPPGQQAKLVADIAKFEKTEKRLILARKKTDGTYEIFSKTFLAGKAGIKFKSFYVDAVEFKKISAAYKKYKNSK